MRKKWRKISGRMVEMRRKRTRRRSNKQNKGMRRNRRKISNTKRYIGKKELLQIMKRMIMTRRRGY